MDDLGFLRLGATDLLLQLTLKQQWSDITSDAILGHVNRYFFFNIIAFFFVRGRRFAYTIIFFNNVKCATSNKPTDKILFETRHNSRVFSFISLDYVLTVAEIEFSSYTGWSILLVRVLYTQII